jgi:hypothetical protein
MFPNDLNQALAAGVVFIGLILVGSALFLFIPRREEAPASAESRAAPRRRVLKAARIEFSGSVIDCLVRNISETGAAIEIASAIKCPIAFVLTIPSDGSVRQCHVVWQRGKRIGVRFKD